MLIFIIFIITAIILAKKILKAFGTSKLLYVMLIALALILSISLIKDVKIGGSEGMFFLKFFVLYIDIALIIAIPIANKINTKKANRIYAAFDGELGDKLKNYLPNNAIVYSVLKQYVSWQDANGEGNVIWFSSLGFRDLPEHFEYVACNWIRDRIVYDWCKYHQESITYVHDHYENSGKATIKRTYTGEYEVTPEADRLVTTETTIGQALVHNGYNFEGRRVNTKPLKKW